MDTGLCQGNPTPKIALSKNSLIRTLPPFLVPETFGEYQKKTQFPNYPCTRYVTRNHIKITKKNADLWVQRLVVPNYLPTGRKRDGGQQGLGEKPGGFCCVAHSYPVILGEVRSQGWCIYFPIKLGAVQSPRILQTHRVVEGRLPKSFLLRHTVWWKTSRTWY